MLNNHNRVGKKTKENLPFRDPENPRILYKSSPRAKRISIKVRPSERDVIVNVPGSKALNKARAFVQQQKDWIEIQLEALPPPQPFEAGREILFMGEMYQLQHQAGRGHPYVDHQSRTIQIPAPPDAFAARTKRFLIREARRQLTESTQYYADQLDKEVEKISVRDTSSRWGSCISREDKGYISYSWRLVCGPDFVLDYVAAHECAHMIEPNHSRAYWAVVESIFPDFKQAKQWLNKNGARLHAVGAAY